MTIDVVCSGMVFLDLVFEGLDELPTAGRERWAAAVASGRVRASGQRADLSGVLPLARLHAERSLPSSP